MKIFNIFRFLFEQPDTPNYYFDDTLSDSEKLNKDWEMIGNDFNKII